MLLKPYATAVLLAVAVIALPALAAAESAPRVVQSEKRVLGYFSADGEFSQSKSANGYVRQYLGKTANGYSVIQDFYVKTGKAQTSPFTLYDDDGLQDWDTLPYVDGTITFYFADGKKLSEHTLKQGKHPIGNFYSYHPNGKIFSEEHYNDDGVPLKESFYDAKGKLLMKIDHQVPDGEASQVTVYQNGKAYPATAAHAAQVETVAKQLSDLYHAINVRHARLSGQPEPEQEAWLIPMMDEAVD